MPAEEQNKISGKLDDMSVVPEISHFDEKAAWSKMTAKLSHQHNGRRLTILWMTAACFVVCLLVPVRTILWKQKVDSTVPKFTAGTAINGNLIETLSETSAPEKRSSTKTPASFQKQSLSIELPLPVIDSAGDAISVTSPQALQADSGKVKQTLPAQRRFPIAHINDILPPSENGLTEQEAKKPRIALQNPESFDMRSRGVSEVKRKRSLFTSSL